MSVIFGEREFEFTVPVLIIGGGASGLTAALSARDKGHEVMVLERDEQCRGSSSMSLGALCAAGSSEQAKHNINDSPDCFYEDIMAKTEHKADPKLARVVAGYSGKAIDWLNDNHDIGLYVDPAWRPGYGHSQVRMHITPGRTGQDLMDRLYNACVTAGVDIVNDAHVVTIFANNDKRILGVGLKRPDGSEEEIGCNALILATCGFGGNHQMVSEYIPSMKNARYFGWELNQGEGINWGIALGAATADMDAYQGLGLLSEPQGIDVNPRLIMEGGIQVNTDGKRFSDEMADVSGQGARVIAQPNSIAWVIYDERIHKSCEDLPQYIALRELGGMKTAATAASLAELIDIPAAALMQELDTIANSAEANIPDNFGRSFSGPTLQAPYYAIRVTGALFHTQGGLVIDEKARVCDPTGAPFPNLFAGGGAARSISGTGPSGYLPGAGLCMAVTLGYIAGSEVLS